MRPDDYCNESNILRRVRYLLQTKHTSIDQLHLEVFGSGFAETSSSPVHENIDNGHALVDVTHPKFCKATTP